MRTSLTMIKAYTLRYLGLLKRWFAKLTRIMTNPDPLDSLYNELVTESSILIQKYKGIDIYA